MLMTAIAVALLVLGGGVFLYAQQSKAKEMLHAGDKAPAFSLPNQQGEMVVSSALAGGWWVLYFYPKDDTPGCTTEACSFRDHLGDLQSMGIRILGVSFDDVASHRTFADKYHLTFDLLADPKGAVIKAYGAEAIVPGFANRVSYLIDAEGVIRKVYPSVTPSQHAAEIIRDVKMLRDGQ